MMVDFATIQVHKDTKERIAAMRGPGESFDTVLQRILRETQQAEEAAFFAEMEALADDKDNIVPLDDVWPTR